MAVSSQNGLKTLREKEKLLVTSNFSFPHSVFKRLVMQTRKNQGLFGKGLTLYQTLPTVNNPEKENIIRKGENAGSRHFFVFPLFSSISKREIINLSTIIMTSANALNLDQS